MLEQGPANDVSRTTVREGHSGDKASTAEVQLFPGVKIGIFPQPLHQILPENIGIGLNENVPIAAGSQSPSLLHHREKLVLIEIPGLLGVVSGIDAGFLGNGTFFLIAIKVEVGVVGFGGFLHLGKRVIDVVGANLLLLRASFC